MRKTILLGFTLLLACEASPWVVENEATITPPEVYFTWFREVAFCIGLTEDATRSRFDRIDWRQGLEIEHPEEGRALGLWTRPHKITIRSDQTGVELVVKHELVHDLLQAPDHPVPYFPRCADPSLTVGRVMDRGVRWSRTSAPWSVTTRSHAQQVQRHLPEPPLLGP